MDGSDVEFWSSISGANFRFVVNVAVIFDESFELSEDCFISLEWPFGAVPLLWLSSGVEIKDGSANASVIELSSDLTNLKKGMILSHFIVSISLNN